ncbi:MULTISPECIES: ATP-dependent nuclease [Pseudomonas]|uniref:ATP-dependent endonuclease n=1 Tax=Pseudomonas plecoglossicida TaxID=70775 RepID=A0ABX4U6H5_PSEDL|nr:MULTISPECIES: AAA family ATPase [Pseudomonas]PLU87289.1 ATP-dependent endonuclease [Pseudomonas plecoglossicida]PLU92985.1 ATP-dependent endonuclease [Pseudomonas plecoglossicida]PLV02476.1 ATP-dependent endonuclease [Pseudomonas plecoglossicida]PLV16716.1 ATP-dependent endonuclease [Pseudomonas plecoglossicida]
MRVARLQIENFRGIKRADVLLPKHAVIVGDNNIGKSTLLEALDLVLGPERLSRRPVIDEHDFYAGEYVDLKGQPVNITIEVVITDLNMDQEMRFRDHIEWWDNGAGDLLGGPPAESTDEQMVQACLRVVFIGSYDADEDDFTGTTYFCSPMKQDGSYDFFRTADKRVCGFLYLRTIRTGSRALSLERGSLLDIILRLQDNKNFKIWEGLLVELRQLQVAADPEIGINDILADVQASIRGYMPSDDGSDPQMRVTQLTRESLRKALTVFMATGAQRSDGEAHAAPFQSQGTGTVNMMVLALLSLIAELKQNVIFAMEEPEIAIPPHIQKRIINGVRNKSAQALFTSHSPYVLEEFDPEQVIVISRNDGNLSAMPAGLPPGIKAKMYRQDMRLRVCEALLARRVLIAEGRTEYDAWPAVARLLHQQEPESFMPLEALGIPIIDATTDSLIAPMGAYYRRLGKKVYAVFDEQAPEQLEAIRASVDYLYQAPEKGFENVVLKGTDEEVLRGWVASLVDSGAWPSDLKDKAPGPDATKDEVAAILGVLLKRWKGDGAAASLLCTAMTRHQLPEFIVSTLESITATIVPEKPEPELSELDDDFLDLVGP